MNRGGNMSGNDVEEYGNFMREWRGYSGDIQ